MNPLTEDSGIMSDIVFTDARIIDGTGAPPFRGRVNAKNGKVEEVSRNEASDTDEVVDAGEAVLAPGFIKAHSHSGFEIFGNPFLTPKLHQKITTEILSQDGLDPAPVSPERVDGWSARMQTLSGSVESIGVFELISTYLDAVDDARPALNLGVPVGHRTIRFEIMGMAGRTVTTGGLDRVEKLLRGSPDNGYPGFSTELIYYPQIHSDTEELLALCDVLSPTNHPFVTYIRNEGHWLFEAMCEFISVDCRIDVPLHLSHFRLSRREQYGKTNLALSFLETTREVGADITTDQYPYVASSTSLSAVLPSWAHGDGAREILRLLREPASKEQMAMDIRDFRVPFWKNDAGTVGWENILICNVGSGRSDIEGMTISEIAEKRDATPLNTCLDLLVEEELNVRIIIFLGREDNVETIFQSPLVCVGSDGFVSEDPHPRLYGAYPEIIGEFVRKKNLVNLEEAARKMISLPAWTYELQLKGIIREGFDAGLISLRPGWISTESSYNNVKQLPTGIDHIIVSGEFVLEDGQGTGSKPGKTLRA